MKSSFCILDLTLDETENELIDTFSIVVGCFTDNLSIPFWNGQVYPVVRPLVVFIVVLDGIRLILVSHNFTTKLRFHLLNGKISRLELVSDEAVKMEMQYFSPKPPANFDRNDLLLI